jgi:hypothetical protein
MIPYRTYDIMARGITYGKAKPREMFQFELNKSLKLFILIKKDQKVKIFFLLLMWSE